MYTVAHGGSVDVVFSRPDLISTAAPETSAPPVATAEPASPPEQPTNGEKPEAEEDSEKQEPTDEPAGSGSLQSLSEAEVGATEKPDEDPSESTKVAPDAVDDQMSRVAPLLAMAIAPFLEL